MLPRCAWAEGQFQEYLDYHDHEWGVPVHDDQNHFEMLSLEGAQAGLSWATILKKRQGYRKAFANFDAQKVASFDEVTLQSLFVDKGIIRNKLKIRSVVNNAQKFLEVQGLFGSFDQYVWSFVDGKPKINHWVDHSQVPATTPQSDALAKDLKRRGFKFVGSTIIYAYMQACGLVNDHTIDCFRHRQLLGDDG